MPTSHGKGKRPRSEGRSSRGWADRMSDDEDDPMDYSEVVFSDLEAENQPNDNGNRRTLPSLLPKVPATRTLHAAE